MKLILSTSALAAVLGCALACAPVTASAQTNTSVSPSPAPAMDSGMKEKKKADYTEYKGTVTAMDATSLTVKNSKGEMKLMTDSSTMYQVNHKKAAMTDFAVGDKVTGSYMTGDDGNMMAHSVHKKASK